MNPSGSLFALNMLFATAGGAMATNLKCTLVAGDPAASQRLCDAVQAKLAAQSTGSYELVVTQARKTYLQASLSRVDAPKQNNGPELSVSVIDRDSLPDQTLANFATSLVASINPEK